MALAGAQAEKLQGTSEQLFQEAREESEYSLSNTLRIDLQRTLRGELLLYDGPIRTRLTSSITGSEQPQTVYLSTTDQDIVLAQINEDRYIREALFGSAYDPDGANQLLGQPDNGDRLELRNTSYAHKRALNLYSWANEHSITNPYTISYGSIHQTTIDHTQGQLTSRFDGSTNRVVSEIQEKQLGDGLITRNFSQGNANLTVQANLTHKSGPMRLTVLNTSRDISTNARILVNGQFVGETGADGTLWTIQPADPIQINATTENSRTIEFTIPDR